MAAPAYNPSLSPVKNLQALLRSLSSAPEATFQLCVAQVLAYLYSTALALSGTLTVAGNVTLGAVLIESVDTRTGPGAVSIITGLSKLVTTGSNDALTLADGAEGQLKRIIFITDGGDGILTPATKTGFTTITFSAIGQSATLQFCTTRGWNIVALSGAVAA